MRLLLRNWHYYVKVRRHHTEVVIEPYASNYANIPLEKDLELQEIRERKETEKLLIQKGINDEYVIDQESSRTENLDDVGHELEWPMAAPYIMLQGYRYLEPINRAILARDKLRSYEKNLQLKFDTHFEPRLYGEDYVKNRQAELFLHRMTPLTTTYLKQGINFLNSAIFGKLIEAGKLSIIRDLLSGGAFESVTFVDEAFVMQYMPQFLSTPRNEFLLNILCFESSLLGIQQQPEQNIQDEYDEQEDQEGQEGQEGQEIQLDLDDKTNLQIGNDVIFGSAYNVIIKNQTDLNRLRLFWCYQNLYLPNEDHFDYIFEQLNHVTFKVAPQIQAAVTDEAKHILTSAYSLQPFEEFLAGLVCRFETFHQFITAYGICTLLLSKLKAIPKLLPENKSNQLHPLFQMIEFNLPKDTHNDLILMIVEMLSHEDHSRIEFENFKRSFNYWLKDYTQPLTTQYHSALTRILEGNEQPLDIIYQRSPSAPAYAKFSHQLKRNKETGKNKMKNYFGESEMVKHILKKDYQPVLDHFVTSFEFTANKQYNKKFRDQIKKTDKTLSFQNQNEAALYKLKTAHNVFFTQSLPEPLSPLYLQPHKQSYDALTSIATHPIDVDEHTEQFKLVHKFNKVVRILQAPMEIREPKQASPESADEDIGVEHEQPQEVLENENVQAEAKPAQEVEAAEAEGEVAEAAEAAEAVEEEEAEHFEQGEGEEMSAQQQDDEERALLMKQGGFSAQERITNCIIDELFYNSEQELEMYKQEFQSQQQPGKRNQQGEEEEDEEEDEELIAKDEDSDLQQLHPDSLYQLYLETDKQIEFSTETEHAYSTEDLKNMETDDRQFFAEKLKRQRANQAFEQIENSEWKFDLTTTEDESSQSQDAKPSKAQSQQNESSQKPTGFRKKGISQKPTSFRKKETTGFRKKETSQKSTGFLKKNRFEFCQVAKVPEVTTPSFEVGKVEEYRRKEVGKDLLQLMQTEQHVSTIAEGNSLVKYLFLHGKNESAFVGRPNKTLNIEFTSVIGTRAKNYEKFIRGNVFRYALSEQLYEELLIGQLRRYNRYEFKAIIAHLVQYCDALNEHIVRAICNICERERIGYTFVEIAQLIKANDVRISGESLQIITDLWQRFDVINEDMLPFLREYTRKMQIPLKTQFYASFCRSLIRTKNFQKLEIIVTAILTDIRPKPFKLDSSMGSLKGDQVAVLEKEWKVREQENYLRLYIELIEVIVRSLDTTVPEYLAQLFDQYRRMKTTFDEKELGYAFVCYALKRDKIEELLAKLDTEPEKGTSFMYDCLLQTLLSNFDALEDLSEKMLDATVLKNRVVLTNEQIMRSLTVFKKSSSSNSFSKFLDHCLRFQETINQSHEIKREMFYILNNNVQDVSVGGIFNLLDFIFNEKREKERVEYRAIKLSEEEKARKLIEIQQSVTKTAPPKKQAEKASGKKEGKKKSKQAEKEVEVEVIASKEKQEEEDEKKDKTKEGQAVVEKELSRREEKKKVRKEKATERERQNELLDQILAEKEAKTLPQTADMRSNSDEEFVNTIKGQTRKHESTKRKGLQSMSTLFEGSLQLSKEEQVPAKGKQQKKGGTKQTKDDKKKGKK